MNDYDVNEFFDKMLIAEEGLDRFILDGFGDDTMRLYHASPFKLKIINPTSWNAGNRLNPKARKSSFWTNDIRYSILWSLHWVVMRFSEDGKCVIPFVHDIDEFKFYVGSGHKPSYKYMITKSLNDRPVFVYEAVIPTNLVSKGQFNINEYTVDVPIPVLKTHIIKPKDVSAIIEEKDPAEIDELINSGIGDTRKRHPNIRERLIFRNPNKVTQIRSRLYNNETQKDYTNYGHSDLSQDLVTESALDWNSLYV